jgi:hypothetical protein
MSKKLAELLDEPEVVVESVIKKLENLSGWESTDVRLLAEINNKSRAKHLELGLDPNDTTGPELYHALLAKLNKDEAKINLPSTTILNQVSGVHKNYNAYSLKRNIAKELLRSHPPRRLMKQLGFRSVDSMLKRENICVIYAGLPKIESSGWLNVFYRGLAKLTPSDFETQEIEIVKMTAQMWDYNNEEKVIATQVPLLGSVAVWDTSVGSVSLAMNVSQCINELRTISALIKLKNVEPNFGKNLVEIVQNQSKHPFKISILPITWQTVFNHYGQRATNEHTEFFGPHMLHEDIKAHNPINLLSKISPVFNWWKDVEYVAAKSKEGLVSLNLNDIVGSVGKNFEQRSLQHSRQSLWHEFLNRYFAHPSVEQHFMQRLETQSVPIMDLQTSGAPEQDIRQMIEAGV